MTLQRHRVALDSGSSVDACLRGGHPAGQVPRVRVMAAHPVAHPIRQRRHESNLQVGHSRLGLQGTECIRGFLVGGPPRRTAGRPVCAVVARKRPPPIPLFGTTPKDASREPESDSLPNNHNQASCEQLFFAVLTELRPNTWGEQITITFSSQVNVG